MDYSNRHGIPDVFVEAILNDPYDAGDADISVTRLISPPQIVSLGKLHAHEIKVDVSDRIWSLLGQAVHTILERAGQQNRGVLRQIEQAISTGLENIKDIADGGEAWIEDNDVPPSVIQVVKDTLSNVKGILFRAARDAWNGKRVLITERRLFTKVQTDLGEWTVSGAFDRMCVEHDKLGDYKVTSVYAATQSDKPAWEQQLNLLAHLCRVNGVCDPKELEIIAILRDWRKSQVGRANYPRTQIMVIPVKVWPDKEVAKFLKKRVIIHQRAAEGDIDPCTPEETWEKPTTWALMKKQPGVPRHEQRAVKIYYNKAEAKAAVQDPAKHYIEERPGELTRCQNYCDVAEHCPQFKAALTF